MRRLLSQQSVDPASVDPATLDGSSAAEQLLDHTPPADEMPGQHVLDQPLALHPRVALRPEPFGALAYHYDTRRLNFLRSHALVALVRSLSDHASARAAFDATGLDAARWPAYAKALEALIASDFIEPRPIGSNNTSQELA